MSAFIRALHLRGLHRHKEAVGLFLEHLAGDPDDAEAHAQLALTRLEMAGERRAALESIDAAIALEADNGHYFAYRSLILSKLDRDKEALAAAESALAFEPDSALAWVAKAQALGGKSRWAEAEEAAREALKHQPEHPMAQNQLGLFLRMQGKLEDADRGTDQRLARDPEDPMAHANAGWAALQRHDSKKAEVHFCEALRLDPELEYARLGLRESYKARSVIYRLFLPGLSWQLKLLLVLYCILAVWGYNWYQHHLVYAHF